MRDLAVAILGTADSTYNNASDLLDDYFPNDTIVYLPSYISSECTGLRVTFDWLKDADIEYVRIKRSELFSRLVGTMAKKYAVVVVGVESSEDVIISAMTEGIPVFDLTRGLYSVTAADVALDSSRTDANGQTQPDAKGFRGEATEGLTIAHSAEEFMSKKSRNYQRRTTPACWDWGISYEILEMSAEADTFDKALRVLECWQLGCAVCGLPIYDCVDHDHETNLIRGLLCHGCNVAEGRVDDSVIVKYRHINPANILDITVKFVESGNRRQFKNRSSKLSSERAHVAVGESGWEPSPAQILDAAEELVAEERFAQTKEVVDETKVKYYKSARGKLRKAGKSKARPGETEVWMTPEEADE